MKINYTIYDTSVNLDSLKIGNIVKYGKAEYIFLAEVQEIMPTTRNGQDLSIYDDELNMHSIIVKDVFMITGKQKLDEFYDLKNERIFEVFNGTFQEYKSKNPELFI